MSQTTLTRNDEQELRAKRRVSADLVLGLTLLGAVIVGRLLWALTDGSILDALGAR